MQVLHSDPEAIYTSLGQAIRKISSTEGLFNLWRGVQSVILGAGPAHAIYFGSYEYFKRIFSSLNNDSFPPLFGSMGTSLAGGLATALSDAVMTPFDVIKQRMQLRKSEFRTIFQCIKGIWAREGFGAFYLSYPTTLLLNVPFHCIQFPTYEYFKKKLIRIDSDGQFRYDPLGHVVAGGVAGGTAAALTTPIDVIKTVIQTRGTGDQRVKWMTDAVRLIMKERGLRGFARGIVPRILTFVPSTAVCWTTYEYFKYAFVNTK
jgi:solute carrier family 25 (mitochondrial iron transporter), member 28/37